MNIMMNGNFGFVIMMIFKLFLNPKLKTINGFITYFIKQKTRQMFGGFFVL